MYSSLYDKMLAKVSGQQQVVYTCQYELDWIMCGRQILLAWLKDGKDSITIRLHGSMRLNGRKSLLFWKGNLLISE